MRSSTANTRSGGGVGNASAPLSRRASNFLSRRRASAEDALTMAFSRSGATAGPRRSSSAVACSRTLNWSWSSSASQRATRRGSVPAQCCTRACKYGSASLAPATNVRWALAARPSSGQIPAELVQFRPDQGKRRRLFLGESSGNVPDQDGGIGAAGGQQPTIGRKSQRLNDMEMSVKTTHFIALRQVPEDHHLVRTNCQYLTVRGNGGGVSAGEFRRRERGTRVLERAVPQANLRLVRAGGNDSPAVGGKGHRGHGISMRRNFALKFLFGQVPQTQHAARFFRALAVIAAGHQALA